MSRRRLVLAGGTVAFTAIGVVRRYGRPSRVPRVPTRSRAAVALPLILIPLNPALFGVDVGGFIGGIFDTGWNIAVDIKNYVAEVVSGAINLVLNTLQGVKDILDAVDHALFASVDWLVTNASNAAQAVATVVADSYQMLDGAFSNLRQQLKAMLEGAWDEIKNWVTDTIPDWIRGVLGEAWDVLTALVGIGLDGISFLVNLIDDPIGFLWHLLEDLITDAINAAFDGFGDVWALLKKIWHILEWLALHADEITEEVLSKLWDLFKWVITHIDDIDPLALDDLFSQGLGGIIDRIVQAGDEERPVFEKVIVGWL